MTCVAKFYDDVIEDVISGVKDEFVEDGGDVQILEELKKLWKSKLAETHVFSPEPVAGSAAQYLNLLQRSQVQIHPNVVTSGTSSVGLPMKHLNTIIRTGTDQTTASVALPGSLAGLRLPAARASVAIPTQVRPREPVQATPCVASVILPAQSQTQKQPQTTSILPTVLTSNANGVQSRPVTAANVQVSATPQLATLPSGLTGHLVQIGQQTYLVPQPITAVRQPGVHLAVPQYVGNPGVAINNPITSDTKPFNISDLAQFKQTQVDGIHDSDDEKFCDTPVSQSMSVPGRRKNLSSGQHNCDDSVASHPHHGSDLEDDDDDDDDLVPATPGFTPHSSVLSHYNTGRYVMDTPRDMGGGTPLVSAPPTPMSPPSVSGAASHSHLGQRSSAIRLLNNAQTPVSKRQRLSLSHGKNADTDESDGCDDVGEDPEIMTTTTTPANPNSELSVENYETTPDPKRKMNHLKQKPKQRSQQDRNPVSPKNNRLAKQFSSPPESELGVPDQMDFLEGDPLKAEEEEEDEEEEPLNSEDDVSDEEPEVLFESDNVVVCQYDKIHRARNKWRFHLKDGIMSINGRDHVFQKAVGEAEW
ncbi:Transcription initiation factor IIA subunit 1 [Schistosoma japonicum]|nr:Transcription initiation factor IIA subunit 1 [Schistosoma japonicum]